MRASTTLEKTNFETPIQTKIVEMHFPVNGIELPSDHAYALFSALCRIISSIHDADWLGIHNIRGAKGAVPGIMEIEENAMLRLRLPLDRIAEVYDIAGKRISVDQYDLAFGAPKLVELIPSSRARARTVILKPVKTNGLVTPEEFLASARRQLEKLNIKAILDLELDDLRTKEPKRRIVTIAGTTIQGYTLLASKLSETDSLTLQSNGIGGRRKFGCGLFVSI